jgi:hypothetical protein
MKILQQVLTILLMIREMANQMVTLPEINFIENAMANDVVYVDLLTNLMGANATILTCSAQFLNPLNVGGATIEILVQDPYSLNVTNNAFVLIRTKEKEGVFAYEIACRTPVTRAGGRIRVNNVQSIRQNGALELEYKLQRNCFQDSLCNKFDWTISMKDLFEGNSIFLTKVQSDDDTVVSTMNTIMPYNRNNGAISGLARSTEFRTRRVIYLSPRPRSVVPEMVSGISLFQANDTSSASNLAFLFGVGKSETNDPRLIMGKNITLANLTLLVNDESNCLSEPWGNDPGTLICYAKVLLNGLLFVVKDTANITSKSLNYVILSTLYIRPYYCFLIRVNSNTEIFCINYDDSNASLYSLIPSTFPGGFNEIDAPTINLIKCTPIRAANMNELSLYVNYTCPSGDRLVSKLIVVPGAIPKLNYTLEFTRVIANSTEPQLIFLCGGEFNTVYLTLHQEGFRRVVFQSNKRPAQRLNFILTNVITSVHKIVCAPTRIFAIASGPSLQGGSTKSYYFLDLARMDTDEVAFTRVNLEHKIEFNGTSREIDMFADPSGQSVFIVDAQKNKPTPFYRYDTEFEYNPNLFNVFLNDTQEVRTLGNVTKSLRIQNSDLREIKVKIEVFESPKKNATLRQKLSSITPGSLINLSNYFDFVGGYTNITLSTTTGIRVLNNGVVKNSSVSWNSTRAIAYFQECLIRFDTNRYECFGQPEKAIAAPRTIVDFAIMNKFVGLKLDTFVLAMCKGQLLQIGYLKNNSEFHVSGAIDVGFPLDEDFAIRYVNGTKTGILVKNKNATLGFSFIVAEYDTINRDYTLARRDQNTIFFHPTPTDASTEYVLQYNNYMMSYFTELKNGCWIFWADASVTRKRWNYKLCSNHFPVNSGLRVTSLDAEISGTGILKFGCVIFPLRNFYGHEMKKFEVSFQLFRDGLLVGNSELNPNVTLVRTFKAVKAGWISVYMEQDNDAVMVTTQGKIPSGFGTPQNPATAFNATILYFKNSSDYALNEEEVVVDSHNIFGMTVYGKPPFFFKWGKGFLRAQIMKLDTLATKVDLYTLTDPQLEVDSNMKLSDLRSIKIAIDGGQPFPFEGDEVAQATTSKIPIFWIILGSVVVISVIFTLVYYSVKRSRLREELSQNNSMKHRLNNA